MRSLLLGRSVDATRPQVERVELPQRRLRRRQFVLVGRPALVHCVAVHGPLLRLLAVRSSPLLRQRRQFAERRRQLVGRLVLYGRYGRFGRFVWGSQSFDTYFELELGRKHWRGLQKTLGRHSLVLRSRRGDENGRNCTSRAQLLFPTMQFKQGYRVFIL